MNKSTHIKDMRFLPPLYLQPCYCWNRFYSSTSQPGNGGCSPRWEMRQRLYQQRRLIQQQGGTVCRLRWAHGASFRTWGRDNWCSEEGSLSWHQLLSETYVNGG